MCVCLSESEREREREGGGEGGREGGRGGGGELFYEHRKNREKECACLFTLTRTLTAVGMYKGIASLLVLGIMLSAVDHERMLDVSGGMSS